MNILAIDTALEACSVGLSTNDARVPVVRSELVARGHAERLFALVEAVINAGGVGLDAIDRFAVTTGPGSFTGIRVGVAAVRGFALVSKAPALGFSTLAVHAESAREIASARPVLASLPAKGGDVFMQLFADDGEELSEPTVATAAKAASLAATEGAALAGAGSAAIAAAETGADFTITHERSAPDIVALLRLAERSVAQASPPKPLYIKPPDAKPAAAQLARR